MKWVTFTPSLVKWSPKDGEKPRILINAKALTRLKGGIPGIGDTLLSRLEKQDLDDDTPYLYLAFPIKKLGHDRESLLGIFHQTQIKGGIITPIDKKAMKEWPIPPQHCTDIPDGELVRFELKKQGRYGESTARILEKLGHPASQKQISLIAIHRHGLPNEFPADVLGEATKTGTPPTLDEPGQTCVTVPLLTIDPEDARDHDDAIWASHDDNPKNEGGFITIVAIADVAHYIRPVGSGLDQRGAEAGQQCLFS